MGLSDNRLFRLCEAHSSHKKLNIRQRFTIKPYGKLKFFSEETRNLIESIQYMNNHWLFQLEIKKGNYHRIKPILLITIGLDTSYINLQGSSPLQFLSETTNPFGSKLPVVFLGSKTCFFFVLIRNLKW